MTDRKDDIVAALSGTAKSAASLVPGIGQAIAGYEAYRKSAHDRNIHRLLGFLNQKIENLEQFFEADWFQTEEGSLFARKVVDAALDIQSEEKQELFANMLINGSNAGISIKEKTKFVDMLRQLSLVSILVLSEIHTKNLASTRRPGTEVNPISALPQIDAVKIAEDLSDRYDPYVVISSVKELESVGLFSNVGSWRKQGDKFAPGQGFLDALAYTDFSARFAEFISNPE